jgi:hypothetical protein
VDLREFVDTRIGNLYDSQMNFFFAAKPTELRLQACEHVEDRRLAGATLADQTYFHWLS